MFSRHLYFLTWAPVIKLQDGRRDGSARAHFFSFLFFSGGDRGGSARPILRPAAHLRGLGPALGGARTGTLGLRLASSDCHGFGGAQSTHAHTPGINPFSP